MKLAYCAKNIRDMATKPIKLVQTNESPAIQISPEKKLNLINTEIKQGPAGTQTLRP